MLLLCILSLIQTIKETVSQITVKWRNLFLCHTRSYQLHHLVYRRRHALATESETRVCGWCLRLSSGGTDSAFVTETCVPGRYTNAARELPSVPSSDGIDCRRSNWNSSLWATTPADNYAKFAHFRMTLGRAINTTLTCTISWKVPYSHLAFIWEHHN